VNLNFSALPIVIRRVIVAAMLLTLGIAAGAFALSFSAQRSWADHTGLWSGRTSWIFPALIDAFFIVAELVLVIAAVFLASRALPLFLLTACAGGSVFFNLMHVPPDASWQVKATAAVPPLVAIGSTAAIAFVVKVVATALGKPLTYAPAAAAPVAGILGPVPTTIYRADLPPAGVGVAYGNGADGAAYPALPSPQAVPYGYGMLPAPHGTVHVPAGQPLPHAGQTAQGGPAVAGTPVVSAARQTTRANGEATRAVEQVIADLIADGAFNAATTVQEIADAARVSYRHAQPIVAEAKRQRGIATGGNGRVARNGSDGAE
jgi:hypothetical protein